MGLRSPAKNRRLRNRNILEVKLRMRGARLARVRLIAVSLAVAIGTVVGLYGLWKGGEWVLERVVFQNEMFEVQTILVQSNGVIPPAEILRWSGVRVGDNLLRLDLTRIQADLELAPLIQYAAVERVPLNTLRIRVVERKPIVRVMTLALRSCGSGVTVAPYYLDGEGYVMDWGAAACGGVAYWPPDTPLPVLEGVPVEEFRSGRRTTLPKVQAALRLVSAFGESAMADFVVLESVDMTVNGLLEVRARVVSSGHVSQVRFGYDRMEEQMSSWRRIHEYGRQIGGEIVTLDLSVRDNIPVEWGEAPAETDAAAAVDPLVSGKERHV